MVSEEQRFYDALRDVFVGADIEGKSGYINLMRMKSRYFQEYVFPQLQEDIDAVLDEYPEFRTELFDKLYDFFHRYFSESGSIYFRRTRYPQSVYEQVYTDQKDVILFWKTHMLYYVKTDRLFRSLEVEIEEDSLPDSELRFSFDVSDLEHKQANEKRDLVYRFERVREDGTIVFQVEYSSHGSKTKMLDILRAMRSEDIDVSEDVVQRAFRVFEKQSEVDFFINKDAEAFLKEQFDLWLYRYVFEGQNVWVQRRLEMLQKLKELSYSIIDFIAQFEDELVRVWNKPKFVRNSHYVITLDRIAERDAELLTQILAYAGIAAQVTEWRDLGMVDEDFRLEDVWERNLFGEQLDDRYEYLPLDTRHVPDLEMAIVGLFEHLDESLDGWLIHSENYQALRTLNERLAGQIKTVYIDPPYNTDASEIMYVNTYKHAAWLSLMDNRLQESGRLMGNDGILCVAIDDSEYHRLYGLITQIFGEESVLSTVAVRSNPSGRSTLKGFSPAHEYTIFVAGGEDATVGRLPRSEEQIARYDEIDEEGRFEWVNFRKHGGANANRVARPRLFYPIYVSESGKIRIPNMKWNDNRRKWVAFEEPKSDEVVVYPINTDEEEKTWKWSHTTLLKNLDESCARPDQTGEIGIYIKSRMKPGTLPSTWWGDSQYSSTAYGTNLLSDILGESNVFSFPKSVYAVEDCLRAADLDKNDLCLDFFAGSGTTAHAVMNLNREDKGMRKYILVEMGEHFDDVLLPRVKKVAFSNEWKDGIAQEEGEGISHFVKYYTLEQYEDALRNAVYVEDAEPFADPYQEVYDQYVFLSDLKQLHALEIDPETHEVRVDLSQLYDDIDLAESLANVRGKRIARLTSDAVTFEDGERIDLRDLDWEFIKPLIWW